LTNRLHPIYTLEVVNQSKQMPNQILKAETAIVKVGLREFEGLMFEDDSFGISASQVCSIFQFDKIHASRDIKAILGKGFQFAKSYTTLHPKGISVLQLTDFEILIRKLEIEDNLVARQLSEDLIGLSLIQLFSDSFGIKFEKEERQAYLIARTEGKVVRRKLTDVIKEWCDKNECGGKVQAYCIYCSDEVNKVVFGVKAKELRENRGVSNNKLLRNTFSSDELRKIEFMEDRIIEHTILDNMKPTDAAKLLKERQQQLK